MDTQTKEELNAWVMKFKKEVNRLEDLIEEQQETIDYDFTILGEIRDDIDEIKTDLQLIKLVLMIELRNKVGKEM